MSSVSPWLVVACVVQFVVSSFAVGTRSVVSRRRTVDAARSRGVPQEAPSTHPSIHPWMRGVPGSACRWSFWRLNEMPGLDWTPWVLCTEVGWLHEAMGYCTVPFRWPSVASSLRHRTRTPARPWARLRRVPRGKAGTSQPCIAIPAACLAVPYKDPVSPAGQLGLCKVAGVC